MPQGAFFAEYKVKDVNSINQSAMMSLRCQTIVKQINSQNQRGRLHVGGLCNYHSKYKDKLDAGDLVLFRLAEVVDPGM